jgi:hypothetical protein
MLRETEQLAGDKDSRLISALLNALFTTMQNGVGSRGRDVWKPALNTGQCKKGSFVHEVKFRH